MFQLENIQFKRGDKATNDAYVGKPGTISIDRESMNVRVHDGVTPGGLFKISEAALGGGGGGIGWTEYELQEAVRRILEGTPGVEYPTVHVLTTHDTIDMGYVDGTQPDVGTLDPTVPNEVLTVFDRVDFGIII